MDRTHSRTGLGNVICGVEPYSSLPLGCHYTGGSGLSEDRDPEVEYIHQFSHWVLSFFLWDPRASTDVNDMLL